MMKRSARLACAVAVLLAGCGGTTTTTTTAAGSGGSGGSGGHGGGGSGGSSNPAEAWVGTWTETGTQATKCGAMTTTTQLQGPVVISLGTGGAALRSTADGCTLASHVTGTTATLDAGQTCAVMVNGVSVTATWTMGSSSLNGNVIVGTAAGTTTGCSFTQQSTLTRM